MIGWVIYADFFFLRGRALALGGAYIYSYVATKLSELYYERTVSYREVSKQSSAYSHEWLRIWSATYSTIGLPDHRKTYSELIANVQL